MTATATPAMAAASAASAPVRPLLHQLQPHRGQPAPASAARGSPESPRHRHRASSAVGDAVTTETIAIDVNGPCSYASAGTPPTAVTPHPSRRRLGGAHCRCRTAAPPHRCRPAPAPSNREDEQKQCAQLADKVQARKERFFKLRGHSAAPLSICAR